MQPNESILSPGEFIREELESRGWTQAELARITGRPLQTINAIIQGTKAITPDTAAALGAAFGNGAEVWLDRESRYRLAGTNVDTSSISKAARLHAIAPVRDMEKRGWIGKTESVEDLENAIRRFFQIASIDDEPQLFVDARKSDFEKSLTVSQRAWCFRAWHLSKAVMAARFDDSKVDECEAALRQLAAYPQESRKVPKILANFGIRFVIVEPLGGSKIDGAAFWLDSNSPVIAVSLRYDRIDSFWFTLCHEFAHIKYRDSASIDTDLGGDSKVPSIAKSEVERRADDYAQSMLIPSDVMKSFILRVSPLYSKERINQFANRVKIHPGIIVGQLQHAGQIGFQANREMLVKIRHFVTESSITDGWGNTLQLEA